VSRKRRSKRSATKAPDVAQRQESPAPERVAKAGSETGSGAAESRRSFLGKAWIVVGLVALVEAFWIVFDFLRPRRVSTADDASVVVAGPIDRFEPGSVTAFPAGKFYLVRLEDGGFLALARECTHLGCTVPWSADENRFVCPCHSSAFDIHGDVLNQPAPRALDHFAVRIENRIVKVDTSEAMRRSSFHPSQVTHA
jgi:cytochrome b6-f complex iron-sulfur subunit